MISRRTLVFVPGLVCDAQVWAPQINSLHEHVAILVADHESRSSLTEMARAILERAPSQFALAGHSMGGRVALEVMRLAPQRVTHLALLDTGYEGLVAGEVGEQEAAKRYALLEIARTQGMRAMGEAWARGMVHPSRLQDQSLMNAIYDMIARKTAAQVSAQIQALLTRPDAADVLPTIRHPTLVLCGEQDTWSPLARHEDIAACIVDSELVVIPECGHMSTMEKPDAVNEALSRWLHGAAR